MLSRIKLEASCKEKNAGIMIGWDFDEQLFILKVLENLDIPSPLTTPQEVGISSKALRLLSFLGERQNSATLAIIFVEQRATANMLAKLLAEHNFCSQPIVGASNHASRRAELGDLTDIGRQLKALEDFRDGTCNVLVSTSAAEEGMDIPACNLVICFDKPQNIRSFIQRRGRARHVHSQFVIMLTQQDDWTKSDVWAALEQDLVDMYTADRQQIERELRLEEHSEIDDRRLVVEATG